MNRKRSPKRCTVNFATLVSTHGGIETVDRYLRGQGYERISARAFRRCDGTFTVRLVWRRRGTLASAATCTFAGLSLP